MKVSEAINTRITTRAFLDKPVPAETLRAILETAKRAPSGGNLQPWHVWVVTGETDPESAPRKTRMVQPFPLTGSGR